MKISGAEKLVRWFIFTVLISLMPLAGSYFGLRVDRRVPSLDLLVGRGELLLISATIAAAAIGELIPETGESHSQAARRWLVHGRGGVVLVVLRDHPGQDQS